VGTKPMKGSISYVHNKNNIVRHAVEMACVVG
jgi:hypothetical protein